MEIGKLCIKNIQIQFDCGHTIESDDSDKKYDEYVDMEHDEKCPVCIKQKCEGIIKRL